MRTDLNRSIRRLKPQSRTGSLVRRPDSKLTYVGQANPAGTSILLDTTVYIDVLNGSTPADVDELLKARPLRHASVILAELTNWFGSLSPVAPGTAATLRQLAGVIGDIPPHRVEAVTPRVMLEAGMLSGLVYRLGGFQPHQTLHAVNDAAIFLHALTNGHTVLPGTSATSTSCSRS